MYDLFYYNYKVTEVQWRITENIQWWGKE